MRSPARVATRLVALVRSDPAGVRAGLVALSLSTAAGLLAGLTLGAITGTLEKLPGLLVLVPAAVGMRGNVFGALGSRLGTAIHTGTFRLSRRTDTVVGQNLVASIVLSLSASLLLAVVAKIVAVTFGVQGSISVADFVVISVIGGLIPSVVVMVITVAVAEPSVRREWDPDNVEAPIVTAAGDVITLPSLFLATFLVEIRWVTPVLAIASAVGALALLAYGLRSHRPTLRQIVRQSLAITVVAGTMSLLAGVALQLRIEPFSVYPALLVLLPPLLALAGSLASILAARVSSKLHLGLLEPRHFSLRPVADDVALVYVLAVSMFTVLGLATALVAALTGLSSPGVAQVVGTALLAGLLATTAGVGIGYMSATVSYRLGLDPDNFGIPVVTAAADVVGAFSLILTLVILGLT